jgi:hypothetical protein
MRLRDRDDVQGKLTLPQAYSRSHPTQDSTNPIFNGHQSPGNWTHRGAFGDPNTAIPAHPLLVLNTKLGFGVVAQAAGFADIRVAAEVAVDVPALCDGGHRTGAVTNCSKDLDSDRASKTSNEWCSVTLC